MREIQEMDQLIGKYSNIQSQLNKMMEKKSQYYDKLSSDFNASQSIFKEMCQEANQKLK